MDNKIKYLIIILILFFKDGITIINAQDIKTIDSLKNLLNIEKTDTNKVNILLKIGKEFKIKQPVKAVGYYHQALEISESINNYRHIANCYENLGIVYKSSLAMYDSSEIYYLKCLKIRKQIPGEKHPDYAITLNNLAQLYRTTGNYYAAEPLYLESMKTLGEVLGEKHPDYAQPLNNLAQLYKTMGNFSAAESLYIKAMNINKETLGEKNVYYAGSLNNLGSLYKIMGNYQTAEKLYLESKNIWEEVLGKKHAYYSTSLNNLATLYKAMGNYTFAENLFIEAMNIDKEILGVKHPGYATDLNNLASLYISMKNYVKADSLLNEAKKIRKEVFGTMHPDYATTLHTIAFLYKQMGNYLTAESLYLESMNIRKKILGEKHPDYAKTLYNLTFLYQAMGNYNAVEPLYLECLKIVNKEIIQNFAFLSEKEKEMYFLTKTDYFSNFYSFSLKRKNEDNTITKTVYNNVIKNKGLMLKSSTAMRTGILNSNDTALISKYEKWVSMKKEISILYSTEISKRDRNPEDLEQIANMLEKDLVRGSQVFSDFEKLQNLTWESVKNSLKKNEAAIEFIRFKCESSNKDTVKVSEGPAYRTGSQLKQFASGKEIALTSSGNDENIAYCALIITPQSKQPEMIKLFEEKQILEILNASSGNNINQINNIYGTNESTKDSLYKLIWNPMEKYLEGAKTIYYSPDGILHKISFAALGKKKNMYLCDNINLKQVSSTGKVVMPENTLIDNDLTACIIGGIDYSADSSSNLIWQYLPGTLTEANAINTKLSKNNIATNSFSGKDATELKFKNIYSNNGTPDIVHIATHGFFFPDPEQIQKEDKKNEKAETGEVIFRGGNSGFGLWQFVKNKNPLMRSGLVLAGANNVWNQRFVGEGEDGVLTAQEVSQLDMSNTTLVVLSACETGLGDIKGSEGVYGLQRAFKMAGVKYIIMSLWQVPDKETEEYMETFYSKLLKLKDIRKSFIETQKEMRKKYDPYYWGAFVLVE